MFSYQLSKFSQLIKTSLITREGESQGTREPGNLKVSQEVLIVYPTHLSRKCDTPKTTQTS